MSFERQRLHATVLTLAMAASLLIGPGTALGQTPEPGTLTPVPSMQPTTVPTPSLTLSSQSGLAGASVTANGSGFKPGETVQVSFGGTKVGEPTVNTGGSFSLSFTVPSLPPGQHGVLATGETSAVAATTTFTINQGAVTIAFSVPQAAPGASLTVTGTGFQPGESVRVLFNGASVGASTVDTKGSASVTFTAPTLAAGQYDVTATGETSGLSTTASYTLLASPTPVPAPAPTATPTPMPAPAAAPAIVHDDRYFVQTGYRIDDDQVWNFFQGYGGLSTFGYPVSRMVRFLGCPVQMFQRHLIQVCPGQGAALINLLDPEIFPYTKVNGSTFPASDSAMKDSTPPVSDPDYAAKISTFVETNVPDTFNNQPVNFLQRFNSLGGLTIWGAPISKPQQDPSNANFIYQRFQRGVMHFIAGTGTESILLADYLKAIIVNQNVPPDLDQQARETRFFNQYCPDAPQSLCRPNELPATDLTFAFVNG